MGERDILCFNNIGRINGPMKRNWIWLEDEN